LKKHKKAKIATKQYLNKTVEMRPDRKKNCLKFKKKQIF
jgi:hypothetical protein